MIIITKRAAGVLEGGERGLDTSGEGKTSKKRERKKKEGGMKRKQTNKRIKEKRKKENQH